MRSCEDAVSVKDSATALGSVRPILRPIRFRAVADSVTVSGSLTVSSSLTTSNSLTASDSARWPILRSRDGLRFRAVSDSVRWPIPCGGRFRDRIDSMPP